jgi:hypothetical protein
LLKKLDRNKYFGLFRVKKTFLPKTSEFYFFRKSDKNQGFLFYSAEQKVTGIE